MDLTRRQLIRGIGTVIAAGAVPRFIPSLVSDRIIGASVTHTWVDEKIAVAANQMGKSSMTFAQMLNEYLPQTLLREEIYKREFLLERIAQ